MIKLYDFQLEAVERIKKQDKYLLAFDPGLGKTLTTLSYWMKEQDNNLFVIAPKTPMKEWAKELLKLTTNIEVVWLDKGTISSLKRLDKDRKDNVRRMYLISYQSSWRLKDSMFEFGKDYFTIIFDESHKAKNHKSAQGKYAVRLSNYFTKVILLTGTPTSVGQADLFNQMKMLGIKEETLKTYSSFKKNYLFTRLMLNGSFKYEVITGAQNVDKLHTLLKTKAFFLTTEDAGVELPEKIDIKVELPFEEQQKKAIKDKVFGYWKQLNTLSGLNSSRQIASGFVYGQDEYGKEVIEKFDKNPKKEALEDLLEEGKNVKWVIFYNFIQELNDVKEVCKKLGLEQYNMKDWNDDIRKDVLTVQYTSGAEGMNLQVWGEENGEKIYNHRIVFYSPTVQGAAYLQAFKRVYRPPQKMPTFIYEFYIKGSVEEHIWKTVKENGNYTDRLFEKDLNLLV